MRKVLSESFYFLSYVCNFSRSCDHWIFWAIYSAVSIFEGFCLDILFDESGYQDELGVWIFCSFIITGNFSMICLSGLFNYLEKKCERKKK